MVGRRSGFDCARLVRQGVLALLIAQVASTYAAAALRPFTVRDSIEMVHLVEPKAAARTDAGDFAISPRGSRFLLLTRRGNLANGANEYKLESFEVSDVLAFANGAPGVGSLPRARVLAARATSPDAAPLYRHAIEQAHWVDENTVTYIGRRYDQVGQVFRVDVRTTKEVQLTASDTDVLRYAMSADGTTIVYSALSFPNWRERNRHGYVVRSQSISEFVTRDPREAGPQLIRYFVKNLATGTVWPSDAEPAVAPMPIWLCPPAATLSSSVTKDRSLEPGLSTRSHRSSRSRRTGRNTHCAVPRRERGSNRIYSDNAIPPSRNSCSWTPATAVRALCLMHPRSARAAPSGRLGESG